MLITLLRAAYRFAFDLQPFFLLLLFVFRFSRVSPAKWTWVSSPPPSLSLSRRSHLTLIFICSFRRLLYESRLVRLPLCGRRGGQTRLNTRQSGEGTMARTGGY